VKSLLVDGHQVWVLTRKPDAAHLPEGAKAVGWDGRTSLGWGEIVNQMDAIVNLVGERLWKWPWTDRQKSRFWNSRVEGSRALVEAIQTASTPPKVLIQASGVNYYGTRDLVPVTEAKPPGNDFLAELCKAWEGSTEAVEKMGVRRIIIRSAIVLSAKDGILPIMIFPVRLFLGGPLGSGRQGLPWIHIEDEVAAIRFLLENQDANGAYNLTCPVPISSAEFMRAVAKQLHRPYWLPIPAFVLRLVLGGMSTLVLDGAYLLPRRLQELGFKFRFATVETALGDLLKS
ncbi:MAG: TIGR01777 family oxidoreductase, partial [Anaerolineales bacterium]